MPMMLLPPPRYFSATPLRRYCHRCAISACAMFFRHCRRYCRLRRLIAALLICCCCYAMHLRAVCRIRASCVIFPMRHSTQTPLFTLLMLLILRCRYGAADAIAAMMLLMP